jgi:hypothetical protein
MSPQQLAQARKAKKNKRKKMKNAKNIPAPDDDYEDEKATQTFDDLSQLRIHDPGPAQQTKLSVSFAAGALPPPNDKVAEAEGSLDLSDAKTETKSATATQSQQGALPVINELSQVSTQDTPASFTAATTSTNTPTVPSQANMGRPGAQIEIPLGISSRSKFTDVLSWSKHSSDASSSSYPRCCC